MRARALACPPPVERQALAHVVRPPLRLVGRGELCASPDGNIIDKRIEYVEKKLAAIRAGEAPDGSTYQDGFGKSRKWTKEEMEGKPTWSFFRPRSWFGYGKLQEVGIASTEQVNSGAGAA